MDRSSRQKINEETVVLNDTTDQFDLDIYRTFHLKAAGYTFFSCTHETFSRIDHMLGHKTSLNKFKKIWIILDFFSDHDSLKLEINYRKKNGKDINTWRLSNILLRNQMVNEEIKEEIRKYLEPNENGNTSFQNLWNATKASNREVYSNTCLPQEIGKISNKQSNLPFKGIRKWRTNKAQS